MQQVIQNFKTGELYVEEVAKPSLAEGFVLVRNAYSAISAGTEKGTIDMAKASLWEKAKKRPDLVKQVLQNVQKEGVKATFKKVQSKLNSLKALGYSSAGTVVASLDTNHYFQPGDRVACAGQDYASHAEWVAVPQNLVARIPDNVSMEEASFTTLGAIAMQGVRQAAPTLGEHICVIGLGLLGQITCQILKANGCNVFGVDLDEKAIQLAQQLSAHQAASRQNPTLSAQVEQFTRGQHFDKVIITAATSSNDPLIFASEILRKKGQVILVGVAKIEVPRNPHFYKKELELKLSCSYGPGRYEPHYEEYGHDYPHAYVRWTEQRNMESFLQLLSYKSVQIQPFITHQFPIEQAKAAYDVILGKAKEPFVGVVLNYPNTPPSPNPPTKQTLHTPSKNLNVGFIGAGSFAQSYLIPHVKGTKSYLHTVITSRGMTAKEVQTKFGFQEADTDTKQVLDNSQINTVFIATRHNSHASLTTEVLKKDKHVFVEKPLAMSREELKLIRETYEARKSNEKGTSPILLVGYNRRFSSHAQKIKDFFAGVSAPISVQYRVNAGFIDKDHWTQQPAGGGRIIGEVCHFIDLMQYFTESQPVQVYAISTHSENRKESNQDNISVQIRFQNGSIGTLTYLANGDKSVAKEYIEVFGGSQVAILDDFKATYFHRGNKKSSWKLQDKGHKTEVLQFLECVEKGKPLPIDFESLCWTSESTFAILDSLATDLPQKVNA